MEKYTRATKNKINNVVLNSSKKKIIELEVKSIELSTVTKNNIKSIQTADNDIEHPPIVTVTFDTGYVEIQKNFRIDPFILPPFKKEKNKLFGNLLSLADVEWDELNKIIGKDIKFRTDNIEPIINKRKPANFEYLIDSNKDALYHDNIDTLFIDIIYNHVHNRKLGYATVTDINTKDNYIKIDFKLAHYGVFTQKLPLDKKEDTSVISKIKDNFNRNPDNLYEDTIGPIQDFYYSYWDFCKESIGYIPNQEEYDEIIGKDIDIVYTVEGWKIKNSMKNIHY